MATRDALHINSVVEHIAQNWMRVCVCVCVQYLQINSNSDSVRVIVIKRSHKFRRNEHNGGLWGTISGRHVRQAKRNENEPNKNDD